MKLSQAIIMTVLSLTVNIAAFANTTQNNTNTTNNSTTEQEVDPSEVSSNSVFKQYDTGNCARKICKRSSFGEVTCKCPAQQQ